MFVSNCLIDIIKFNKIICHNISCIEFSADCMTANSMTEDCMTENCITENCMTEDCMTANCMTEECMTADCMTIPTDHKKLPPKLLHLAIRTSLKLWVEGWMYCLGMPK